LEGGWARAVAAALLVLSLTGCRPGGQALLPQGAQSPVVGGQVTEAIVGDTIGPLNPLFEQDQNAQDVDALIYQGLTEVGPDQQPVGLLASGWSESSDDLSYTFTLRHGVRWADGAPFTAADVVFTFGVLQSPQYRDPNAQYWKEVQVQETGPDQVRFTLKAPSASFPLIVGETGILPRHIFAGVAIDRMAAVPASGSDAIGTGPFRVQSISSDGRTVTLIRNPYARPRPNLARFVFREYPSLDAAVRAVTTGVADTLGGEALPSVDALTRHGLRVLELSTFDVVAVYLNLGPEQAGLFGSATVRQALVEGVDRQRIVADVMQGRADPAPGPIPPSSWAYSARAAGQYGYDPQGAARLLRQAGWVRGAGGVLVRNGRPFSVTLATPAGYPYLETARAVAQQLGRLGVQVRVEPMPATELLSRDLLGGEYQMAIVSIDNGPDPDPYSLWHSGLPSGSLNFSSGEIPHQALIDRDLDEGRLDMDRTSRQAAYADFQNLIAYAAPAIFLFEPHYTYLVANRVRGVRTNSVITPAERFEYVASWYVVTQAG
jgi:peptide/nickel transport system substrate-binding protein